MRSQIDFTLRASVGGNSFPAVQSNLHPRYTSDTETKRGQYNADTSYELVGC